MESAKYWRIYTFLADGTAPETVTNMSNFRKYVRTHKFFIKNSRLFVRKKIDGKILDLRVIQKKDLTTLWNELHVNLAHPGRDKTWALFRSRFWFVGSFSWIAEKTKECLNCSQKRFHLPPKKIAPLSCIPATAAIMSRIHVDLTEGFYDVNGKHSVVIIAVDSFIKYVEGEVIPDKSANSIAMFLWKNIFCRYLTPLECIIHDRDQTLKAKIMKVLFKRFGCKIKITLAGNPQSNGQAEIFHKTIKERINALLMDHNYELPEDWANTILPQVLCGIRCSPAHSTGQIPAELLLGRKLVFPFEVLESETLEENISRIS
jgi:hypothetical protein